MSRVKFTRFFKTKTLILLVFLLVFYSYFCDLLVFLWFRAHSTRCELFGPVKSYGNDSAILKQSKNMLLNFELHRSTMNLHQKMCWFTHFCRKNVASRIYALFKNKNFNFTRIFTRILFVFLLKKYSYFARIFEKI